jgi:hypothetical protein
MKPTIGIKANPVSANRHFFDDLVSDHWKSVQHQNDAIIMGALTGKSLRPRATCILCIQNYMAAGEGRLQQNITQGVWWMTQMWNGHIMWNGLVFHPITCFLQKPFTFVKILWGGMKIIVTFKIFLKKKKKKKKKKSEWSKKLIVSHSVTFSHLGHLPYSSNSLILEFYGVDFFCLKGNKKKCLWFSLMLSCQY